MSSFIKKANLPEGKVDALICGRINEKLSLFFESNGIRMIYVEDNTFVDRAVSGHADISALYLGEGRIVVDCGQRKLITHLKKMGLSVMETAKKVEGRYPDDCILNHTVIGHNIIGKESSFDNSVKRLCREKDIISVNQGYCKCSTLVVDETSVITDDESVARSVCKKGLNCLLISKGDVFLEGHSYGFIGGASGKISKNEIVFFGDIMKHRDYNKIKEFIYDRGMKIISLDFPLSDFGGIIPIMENLF